MSDLQVPGLDDAGFGPITIRPFEKPPMWDEINAAFNVEGKDVLFAFGRCVFCPMSKGDISQEKYEHEKAHCIRQMSLVLIPGSPPDPIEWWTRYIHDPVFRLVEEIVAHYAEYQYLAASAANRRERRIALSNVARQLASPLYGNLISLEAAKKVLEQGPGKAIEAREKGVRV